MFCNNYTNMGKTKNRDNIPSKKDKKLSLRLNSVLLDELQRKSNCTNSSKAINQAIKEYIESKRSIETNYECDSCRRKILKQELYYCNLDQLEIRMDNEIIVTKGEPKKILCMKCAKKEPQILEFIESKDEEEGDLVGESNR
jgi:hypothetical protein